MRRLAVASLIAFPIAAVCAVAFIAIGPKESATQGAPRVPFASFEQLPQPLPLPYDENADADGDVAAALARAKAQVKLLLIDLGGNWCLDCRLLAGTIGTQPLADWMAQRFEIVTVDVGRFDRNQQVPARYGIEGRLEGVPAILIVEPNTGKLINAGHVTALADARSMTPQALANWFAGWAADQG